MKATVEPVRGSTPPGSAPAARRRRRRWPWAVLALAVVVGSGAAVFVLGASRAHPVTMGQAERQFGGRGQEVAGDRPSPGVYRYTGSGTEHLSLPPLSQAEGPTLPGTVTLEGADCWVLRIDYSSHHWQTWDYCRHGADTWEAGGQSWQLWAVGPVDVTNTSDFTCAPRTMSLPGAATVGETWNGRCTGTNTSVKGKTLSAGPYRFEGLATLTVGGKPVRSAHFLRLRTDTGAQHGTERSEVWLDAATGLPLKLSQDIVVTTNTPFGTSTYTQSGVMTLASLVPAR